MAWLLSQALAQIFLLASSLPVRFAFFDIISGIPELVHDQ